MTAAYARREGRALAFAEAVRCALVRSELSLLRDVAQAEAPGELRLPGLGEAASARVNVAWGKAATGTPVRLSCVYCFPLHAGGELVRRQNLDVRGAGALAMSGSYGHTPRMPHRRDILKRLSFAASYRG